MIIGRLAVFVPQNSRALNEGRQDHRWLFAGLAVFFLADDTGVTRTQVK